MNDTSSGEPDGQTDVLAVQPAISDDRTCVGRVGAPMQQEATSQRFCFWVPRDVLVEATQLVTCSSRIASETVTFYGVVNEVHRRSRKRDMANEVDESDGEVDYVPPFETDGYTFADAAILRTEPPVLTPPVERSQVLLAGPNEARMAYAADEIEHPLAVGLVKNGGSRIAGPGAIDLDYLLGVNGGHLNVNGTAGRGTKSSFLLHVNWLLLQEAQRQAHERPSDEARLRVVPIILNVKNFDLFHIDRRSKRFDPVRHLPDWQALGVEEPCPFGKATFYAPQEANTSVPVSTGRLDRVEPYSWSLNDVIEQGLFAYLFADADTEDINFNTLAMDIENWLTQETTGNGGAVKRSLRQDAGHPTNFMDLAQWIRSQPTQRTLQGHHHGTWNKLYRRLLGVLYEGKGVLRYEEQNGHPLDLVRHDTCDPIVVDLAALGAHAELQRFVVATILRQLVEARTGVVGGPVYVVTLDELNRFAPRGARDPITQLIERVAAEMRSQGIILFGAQQQASKVSEKVIENAAIRVLGKSGSVELSASVWRFLSDAARRKAEMLPLSEKLICQDNFREPMHLRIPFPVWAMNPREAGDKAADSGVNAGFDPDSVIDG